MAVYVVDCLSRHSHPKLMLSKSAVKGPPLVVCAFMLLFLHTPLLTPGGAVTA